ncbi:site-specific integrase [Janibacter terrae]|uniref:tyrosine-type recombinase/integrase n=1 Tax=Janibacter terrae TaxID=103817 RepID=UPI0031F992EB
MASIETRETRAGTSYRVRFRHQKRNRSLAFDTRKAAEAWMRLVEINPEQALAALETPTDAALPPTVLDMVTAHIDQLTGVEAGTRANYRGMALRHVEPHPLAGRLAAGATRADVGAWVTWLQEERGLSGKTIANLHGLMSAAFTTATRDGVRLDNPCRGMRLPRTTHTEREHCYLTHDEFATIHALIPRHYQPLSMLLAGTGIRFGEATALQVHDLDLGAREARIRRAWKPTGEGGQRRLGPTKTLRSTRTIAVPERTCEVLEPLLRGKAPGDLIIVNRRGRRVTGPTFWQQAWRPAVAEFAGDEFEIEKGRKIIVHSLGDGKHPRVHDLRHSWASWHIQAGTPLPVIQRQMGHESIQTTIDTYGHLARADFDALGAKTSAWLPARGDVAALEA